MERGLQATLDFTDLLGTSKTGLQAILDFTESLETIKRFKSNFTFHKFTGNIAGLLAKAVLMRLRETRLTDLRTANELKDL